MKFFKIIRFLTPIALVTLALAAVGIASSSAIMSKAEGETTSSDDESAISVPSEETLVDSSLLHISITSSSTTNKSHSIGARFSSSIDTFMNRSREQNLYFTIEDSSYNSEAELNPEYDENNNLIGPVYNASCYTMFNTKSGFSDVVIPSTINRDKGFILDITSIAGGCAPSNAGTANRSQVYTNVTSIIIPKHITTVYKDAFTEVPDEVTIKCEATERPDGWDEEWTDAKNIEWGYTLSSSETGRLVQNGGMTKSFASNNNYIIGSHYEEKTYYKPLLATYSILDANGNVTSTNNIIEIPLTSTNTPYDDVGVSRTSLDINFDIEKSNDQKIDVSSIIFHNIYLETRADFSGGTNMIVPDLSKAFYGVPTISYSNELNITDLVTYQTSMVSSYVGYLDFNLSVDKVPDVYPKLMSSMYEANKSYLDSGEYVVRYLFDSLNQASYRFTYKSNGSLVTTSVSVSTPIDLLVLSKEKDNYAGFSIKMSDIASDFSFDNIVLVELIGLRIKLDMYSNDTAKSVNKSSFSRRFGIIEIYNAEVGSSYMSIETMIIMWTCIYIGIFIAASLAYYFYAKNRFKNDEFRRVDTKKFIVAASKNLLGFGLIVLAILYNIARWSIMNTSIVAFNPVDAYLIIFTVAGGIFLVSLLNKQLIPSKMA